MSQAVVFDFEAGHTEAAPTVRLTPGMAVENTVSNSPIGTRFLFTPGRYRRLSIEPRYGQSFIGMTGAVLDGENNARQAFHGSADNVSIRGLEIRFYASHDFNAAIEIADLSNQTDKGYRWLLEDLHVHANRSHGVNLGHNTTIRNSLVASNGLLGIGGRDFNGGLIESNVVVGNNTRNSYPDSHGGGIKTSNANGLTIRGNTVQNNTIAGIWCDIACDNWTVQNNLVKDHYGVPGSGIHFEVSKGATITGNTVIGCGRPSPAWAWGAGIQISTSRDATIDNNVISECDTGIGVVQQGRSSPEISNLQVDNIKVRNNRMTSSGRSPNLLTGVVRDTGSNSIFGRNIVFSGNTYLGAPPKFWWQGQQLDWPNWRLRGFDLAGSYLP